MNRVYVVVINDCYDYDLALTVEVFDALTKALEFKNKVIEEHKNTHNWCEEELKEENVERYYSHYVDGCYSSDHFDIEIIEKEIK